MDSVNVRKPRRWRWAVALLVLLCIAGGAGWSYRQWWGTPEIIKGPMVQRLGPGEFTLVWETGPGAESWARVANAAGFVDGTVLASYRRRHVTHFKNLPPATSYRYQVLTGQHVLCERDVRAAPAQGAGFRMIAFGDSGTGEP